MLHVGVDLHKSQFTVAFMIGESVTHKIYRNDGGGIQAFLCDLGSYGMGKDRIKLAVETTGNVWYFVQKIEGHVKEVQVVNTVKFKIISDSAVKTDKVDSETIAYFLKKEMLPTVVLPDVYMRKIAKFVKVRDRFVKISTSIKNQIIALLWGEGVDFKKSLLTSQIGLTKLMKVKIDEDLRMLLQELVDELGNLQKKIHKIEYHMGRFVAGDPVVETLRTISGCGLISACAIRGILGDGIRFDHPRQVGKYAGLIPKVKESNGKKYFGRITKHGSAILRNAFVQMATAMMRRPASLKKDEHYLYAWAKRKQKQRGKGVGKIALARKLSELVWVKLHQLAQENDLAPAA